MSNEVAISVENLGKRYRIGHSVKRQDTFAKAAGQALAAPFRYLKYRLSPSTDQDTIWALKDVSFEVKQGEVLGIIGANGAGKSTLLKILSRITDPTEGRATIKGRVNSLLEVGTGFHPELTGRENIYLSAAIQGMKKKEVEAKLDEIIDFSGIAKFLDTPIKRYSSGMTVRLGFAVAANLDPDVLIIDEVLAVGDAGFQRKCLSKVKDITGKGRTVLFVSHNMGAVSQLCDCGILLEQGVIKFHGEVQNVVAQYLHSTGTEKTSYSKIELEKIRKEVLHSGVRYFNCTNLRMHDLQGAEKSVFHSDDEICFSIQLECICEVPSFKLYIQIFSEKEDLLIHMESLDSKLCKVIESLSRDKVYQISCILPKNLFGEKSFFVTIGMVFQDVYHLTFSKVFHFDVAFVGFNKNLSKFSRLGYIRPRVQWVIK